MLQWGIHFSGRNIIRKFYIVPAGEVQMVKNLPAVQGSLAQFLGREDPLEKGMATHTHILACRIPWTEEPDRLQSMVSQRVRHNWETNIFTFHCEKKVRQRRRRRIKAVIIEKGRSGKVLEIRLNLNRWIYKWIAWYM